MKARRDFSNVTKALSIWGNIIGGYVVGPIVFVVVLTGIVQATGAAPGGILRGPIGAVLSFGLHALWGILAALFQVVGWLGLFMIVLGLIASVRRRAPWYTALLGVVVLFAAALADGLRNTVSDFLGSASPWDAAAFWGALVGTYIQLGARLPMWANEIWSWPNRRDRDYVPVAYTKRIWLVHKAYMGSDTDEGFGKSIVSTVDAALLLGVCLVGWQLNGWVGTAIGLVAGATVWGIARGVVWLVGGALVSLCVVLPLAVVLALWEPDSEVRAAMAAGVI